MLITCILGCLGFEIGADLRLNEHQTSYSGRSNFCQLRQRNSNKNCWVFLSLFLASKRSNWLKDQLFHRKIQFWIFRDSFLQFFFFLLEELWKIWMRFVIWIWLKDWHLGFSRNIHNSRLNPNFWKMYYEVFFVFSEVWF